MRYLYFVLLCVYTVTFASCTYHFDLEDVNESPQLVMYSYPGSGDTTVVRLYQSLPVNQKGGLGNGLQNAEVQLMVNDEVTRMIWTDDSIPGVPACSYYAIRRYKDGDRVRVTAVCGTLKAESSSTVIPSSFPLNSLSLVKKPNVQGKMQFCISFTDNAMTKNWYAVRVERKQMLWSNTEYTETVTAVNCELDDEPLLHSSSGLDDILMIENDFYKNLYFWDDEKIQGKAYTLRLNANYMSDYEEDFITPEGNEHLKSKTKYRAVVYSISEEFYRYLKSLNDLKNNGLGNSELAPTRSTYTNIKNGIGVVGGCRIYQTPWMDNL